MEHHQVDLDRPPAEAAAAIARVAEGWGADWQPDEDGGRLALPVIFGLRRGHAVGRLAIDRLENDRTRLTWTLEESHLEVHRSSVAVLAMAALPALAVLGSPLWPPLFALAPMAAILGLLAWWLVVSRLRTSGPEDFLQALAGEYPPAVLG